MTRFLNSLFGRVMIALVIGIIVGAAWSPFRAVAAAARRRLSEAHQDGDRPIVFCVVVSNLASAGDLKKVGRVGLKAVVYFEFVTTLALIIGAILAWVT